MPFLEDTQSCAIRPLPCHGGVLRVTVGQNHDTLVDLPTSLAHPVWRFPWSFINGGYQGVGVYNRTWKVVHFTTWCWLQVLTHSQKVPEEPPHPNPSTGASTLVLGL